MTVTNDNRGGGFVSADRPEGSLIWRVEPVEPPSLAARAVACKRWKWRSVCGALAAGTGYRVEESMCESDWGELERGEWGPPDLSDPATLGAVESLLPEGWYVNGDPDGYRVDCYAAGVPVSKVRDLHGFSTRAEAVVAALEAAE